MIRHPSNHGGLTVGGVSVGLGVIAVLAALVHPRIEGARYEARVAETLDMVAVLEGWATGQYRSQGRWPTGSAPADILSVELARGDDGSYRHVDGWYTV
ncbi:MAG: hypothetical protein OEZ37_13800, partial [Gemmatimonadota bacterium]|nr:hypothetical protein [Gemmatimonadota bacterium]